MAQKLKFNLPAVEEEESAVDPTAVLRNMAAMGVRLGGGTVGSIVGTVPSPLTTAGAAAIGGGSEALAELIEGSPLSKARIGTEAALTAIPGSMIIKAGGKGLNLLRSAAQAEVGNVGRRVAAGEGVVPETPLEAAFDVGSMALGAGFGHLANKQMAKKIALKDAGDTPSISPRNVPDDKPVPPPSPNLSKAPIYTAPDPATHVVPEAVSSKKGLRIALDKHRQGTSLTPDEQLALRRSAEKNPSGAPAREIGFDQRKFQEGQTLASRDAAETEALKVSQKSNQDELARMKDDWKWIQDDIANKKAAEAAAQRTGEVVPVQTTARETVTVKNPDGSRRTVTVKLGTPEQAEAVAEKATDAKWAQTVKNENATDKFKQGLRVSRGQADAENLRRAAAAKREREAMWSQEARNLNKAEKAAEMTPEEKYLAGLSPEERRIAMETDAEVAAELAQREKDAVQEARNLNARDKYAEGEASAIQKQLENEEKLNAIERAKEGRVPSEPIVTDSLSAVDETGQKVSARRNWMLEQEAEELENGKDILDGAKKKKETKFQRGTPVQDSSGKPIPQKPAPPTAAPPTVPPKTDPPTPPPTAPVPKGGKKPKGPAGGGTPPAQGAGGSGPATPPAAPAAKAGAAPAAKAAGISDDVRKELEGMLAEMNQRPGDDRLFSQAKAHGEVLDSAESPRGGKVRSKANAPTIKERIQRVLTLGEANDNLSKAAVKAAEQRIARRAEKAAAFAAEEAQIEADIASGKLKKPEAAATAAAAPAAAAMPEDEARKQVGEIMNKMAEEGVPFEELEKIEFRLGNAHGRNWNGWVAAWKDRYNKFQAQRAAAAPKVRVEEEPTLPGDVGKVAEMNNPTPKVAEVPFSLSRTATKAPKVKQQPLPEGHVEAKQPQATAAAKTPKKKGLPIAPPSRTRPTAQELEAAVTQRQAELEAMPAPEMIDNPVATPELNEMTIEAAKAAQRYREAAAAARAGQISETERASAGALAQRTAKETNQRANEETLIANRELIEGWDARDRLAAASQPEPPKARAKGARAPKKGFMGNRDDVGEINPGMINFLTRGMLGAGGALGGAAVDRDNPTRGALVGGALGLAGPSIAKRVIESPASMSSMGEKLQEAYKAAPEYMRFSLLTDFPNILYNAHLGPWSSGLIGGVEEFLSGNQDEGLEILKRQWRPDKFAKGMIDNYGEATEAIGRNERGELMTGEAPGMTRKLMAGPGTVMTSGDITARYNLMGAGLDEDRARNITLTGEPWSKYGENSTNFSRGSTFNKMLLPFVRTAANIVESGAERTPLIGFFVSAARERATGIPIEMQRQIAQQGMGGMITFGAYELGKAIDPETVKQYRIDKAIANMGGQYSLLAAAGFEAGQAAQMGKDPFMSAVSNAAGNLPLPTTQVPMDIAKSARGIVTQEPAHPQLEGIEKWLPRVIVPGALRSMAGEDPNPILSAVQGDTQYAEDEIEQMMRFLQGQEQR